MNDIKTQARELLRLDAEATAGPWGVTHRLRGNGAWLVGQAVKVGDMPGERPEWWPPRIGGHALRRFQVHYPGASVRDALWDLTQGREVAAELVAVITCAPSRARSPSLYIAGRERCGVWVLERSFEGAETYPWTVVTYLRFSEQQRVFLEV